MNLRVTEELRPCLFHFCVPSAGHVDIFMNSDGVKGPCRVWDVPMQLA